jgi:hypothetical protein
MILFCISTPRSIILDKTLSIIIVKKKQSDSLVWSTCQCTGPTLSLSLSIVPRRPISPSSSFPRSNPPPSSPSNAAAVGLGFRRPLPPRRRDGEHLRRAHGPLGPPWLLQLCTPRRALAPRRRPGRALTALGLHPLHLLVDHSQGARACHHHGL